MRTADAHYANLQSRYTLTTTGDYERLVTAWGNAQAPIHRWFHVKEAYSHLLLGRVIKDVQLDGKRRQLTIHDPFGGSGTTIAAAGDYADDGLSSRVTASAVEVNPFLHLLTSTKAAGYTQERPDLLAAAKRVVAAVTRDRVTPAPVPALSTFHNSDYFPPESLGTLLKLSAAIAELGTSAETAGVVPYLQVCLAAAIEPSSRLRRDGRALRYENAKVVSDPAEVFLERAHEMHLDWRYTSNFSARVDRGDARDASLGASASTDLVLFSPPYPNNIDYTEVYKLENWLLGFIDSAEEFTAQRRRTLRSHPSIKFAEEYQFEADGFGDQIREFLDPICAAVPESRYRAALERTIVGYTDDMWAVIRRSARILRPGGHLVYVVGNSYHGDHADGVVIAADLMIARLCEQAGLDVVSMDIARVPRRRRTGSAYLRETVVFARKPIG